MFIPIHHTAYWNVLTWPCALTLLLLYILHLQKSIFIVLYSVPVFQSRNTHFTSCNTDLSHDLHTSLREVTETVKVFKWQSRRLKTIKGVQIKLAPVVLGYKQVQYNNTLITNSYINHFILANHFGDKHFSLPHNTRYNYTFIFTAQLLWRKNMILTWSSTVKIIILLSLKFIKGSSFLTFHQVLKKLLVCVAIATWSALALAAVCLPLLRKHYSQCITNFWLPTDVSSSVSITISIFFSIFKSLSWHGDRLARSPTALPFSDTESQ